jgi:hypothetical protein
LAVIIVQHTRIFRRELCLMSEVEIGTLEEILYPVHDIMQPHEIKPVAR